MIFQQTFTLKEKITDVTGAAGAVSASVQWELTGEAPAQVIPCRISSVTTRNDYKPTPLTGAEGQQVIDRLNEFSGGMGVVIEADGTVVPGNND